MEFYIEWVNGAEFVKGESLEDATAKIKTPINEILTGYLVRVKEITRRPKYSASKWRYWDCRSFWNALAGVKKKQ